jgi:hydroxymethylglutaryl-CoA lyase
VKIVEVGPRDGLQNERTALAADIKATLIDRLSALGLSCVESGSFVSPKWVPQVSTAALRHSVISSITDVGSEMAGTADVLTAIAPRKGVSYPVLVPNAHGLQAFLALRRENPELSASLDEIAVFTAASDAFSRANTNVSVAESLAKLEGVAADARKEGLRVRGYVSVVIECPYGGRVEPARVREVSRALRDMGCYEVSLGDTVGRGTPDDIHTVVAEVAKDVPVGMLAGHVSRPEVGGGVRF